MSYQYVQHNQPELEDLRERILFVSRQIRALNLREELELLDKAISQTKKMQSEKAGDKEKSLFSNINISYIAKVSNYLTSLERKFKTGMEMDIISRRYRETIEKLLSSLEKYDFAIRSGEHLTKNNFGKIKYCEESYTRFKAFTHYSRQYRERSHPREYTAENFKKYSDYFDKHKEAYCLPLKNAVLKLQSGRDQKLARKRPESEIGQLPFSIFKCGGDLYAVTGYCLAPPTRRSITKIVFKITVEFENESVKSITIHFHEPLAIKIVHLAGLKVAQQNQDVYKHMYGETFRLIRTPTSHKTYIIMPIFPGYSLGYFLFAARDERGRSKCIWSGWENYSKNSRHLYLLKVKLCLALAIKVKEYHDKGWVLMDLKPENIIVNNDGEWDVNIIDADDILQKGTSLINRSYGSIAYKPPDYEKIGEMKADVYFDIYALGKIFTEIFTGKIQKSEGYGDKLSAWFYEDVKRQLDGFRYNLHENFETFINLVVPRKADESLSGAIAGGRLVFINGLKYALTNIADIVRILTALERKLQAAQHNTHNPVAENFRQHPITAEDLTIR